MSQQQLSEQEEIRRNSLQEIIRLGINPYPSEEYLINTGTREILNGFDPVKQNFREVSIAGRIMSRRIMGNASFAGIQDETGRIQVYLRRDEICPGEDKTLYNTVFKKLLDIGDIIGVKGFVFKTQVGETTVHVKELSVLTKSLRPLPIVKEKDGEVYDAFTDAEQRYRQRYVDLVVNPHVRNIFTRRSKIIESIRRFLNERNYLEVETPILQPIYGGAAAKPFTTFHNKLEQKLYLRIANELYLKRLIVGGFPGIYEFAKDFRNEGMDRYHNPEFTQVELYVAYKDYLWMMNLVEEMIEKVTLDLYGDTKVQVGDTIIDFKRPWKRYTMYGAIKEFTDVDISEMSEKELFKTAKELGVEVDETMGKGKLIDEIFGETVEGKLIQPTYIMDYPIEMSPLAKKHREKEGLVERFEAIVNGKELCNAFSELNDPIDQRERFEEQVRLGKRGDEEAMVLDEDFLRALEYGMPPTAGLGIGIDRLVMTLTNSPSIQDVIFFPQMKPEKQEQIDGDDKFVEIGVPKEWIEPLKTLGFTTVDALKAVEKPGKLANDLNGYKKKKKLDLPGLSPEVVGEWLENARRKLGGDPKALSETVKEDVIYYDYHTRIQSPSWLIKHIETIVSESRKYNNASLALYGAFEMRNLIEKICYDLIVHSTHESEWSEIERIAKGKQGIRRSNAKYKTLKYRFQTFSEVIAKVGNIHIKAFDYKRAEELENELGEYVHTYTRSQNDFNFDGEFISKCISKTEEALQFIKDYFIKEGKSYKFGVLNFSTLTGEYKTEFVKWKSGVSMDTEALFNKLKELNEKDPLTFTKR